MSKIEKIGRPSIKEPESGTDIELGQPVKELEFEKESIEATFPVIKEALDEFYAKRASRDQQTALSLQVMRDTELPYVFATRDLEKGKEANLALVILESVRGELQLTKNLIELRELESENSAENKEMETEQQKLFEQDLHYQEASDLLFSRDGYDVPTRQDFIEWLGETRGLIKKLAKEEEEKFRGAEEGAGIGQRPFRSRLLTDIPAIERFETGQETMRDYRQIMDVLDNRLLVEREHLGTLLLRYADDNKMEIYYNEMAKTLASARQMELLLAMAEGERNERIAKKQP